MSLMMFSFYGENEIRVVLYGPQGKSAERREVLNVAQDNVPKGKPGTGLAPISPAETSLRWKASDAPDLPSSGGCISGTRTRFPNVRRCARAHHALATRG
jgi:hypothetical protein